jgi:drug/metabolite transporter (DMT)-like permease
MRPAFSAWGRERLAVFAVAGNASRSRPQRTQRTHDSTTVALRQHGATGRWRVGLALALTTAVLWGLLPIALKIALRGLDPYTITWYRFAVSSVVLGLILAATGGLPRVRSLNRQGWALLAVALGGLVGNYVLYLVALALVAPTVAQTVIQLAPVGLLVGGVVVFKERFSRAQQAGLAVLLIGLLLFFNRRLAEFRNPGAGLALGVFILVVAAGSWGGYGLAQKALLRRFRSQQILWLLYVGAVFVLLPSASLSSVLRIGSLQFWMLAFSCMNTLVAYGAFAEALEHWEVSRVSAVLTVAPLVTIASSWLIDRVVPGVLSADPLNALSVAGALLVVGGSAACALAAPGAAAHATGVERTQT